METDFVHLHVHTNFSFLDSGSSIKSYVKQAKELGFSALAITDHNGLYGAIRFYRYAIDNGIKPIIGVEMQMMDGHHIVLLAKNLNGYSNLCRMITKANLSDNAAAPKIGKRDPYLSWDVLAEYKEDIICLSGSANGVVPSLIMEKKYSKALEAAEKFAQLFGHENYYIELQNHLLPGTAILNKNLCELAEELNLQVVTTNNCHYALKEDAPLHDIMASIQTTSRQNKDIISRKRNHEYYLKSAQEMIDLFSYYPQAIANTTKIANQCMVDLRLGEYHFPRFTTPHNQSAYEYLYNICLNSLSKLYSVITPDIIKRLDYELGVIESMGFSEYFLVVWDIVRFAKENGIRCSGRGSAADSLAAYCLGITIADPIRHDLLFERFLNPERKGMPDIDIDFDSNRRDEVIDYIYKRYGADRVAMVCTVSTLIARSSIREIGKVMGIPYEYISRMAKSIPHTSARKIRSSIEKLPELQDESLPVGIMDKAIDYCEKADGFPRHLSVHLGGLVIGGNKLTDLVPLEYAAKGVIVTQYDKDDIEALGLVKMDILGLKNLSAIEEALETLRVNRGIELDIDNIPLDDSDTYKLLCTTDTIACFQVESPGMRGLLGKLQPETFDDIIAQISLFRPGPMRADMIAPFIERRHGREDVCYIHPLLEDALKETYGVIIYQEQVLRVANAIAGFSFGQSDALRRAMTRDRSNEEMERIRNSFIEGALGNGIDDDIAEDIFEKLRAFAAYGFCKAHAASFAKIAYQTAYLKAHYPAEFIAGILSCEPMGFYPSNVILEEAKRMGIGVLGVDVNRSIKKFSVENGKIRIGLMQVKGISDMEIKSILWARNRRWFESIKDFCRRTKVSQAATENLIICGAFDFLKIPRRKLLWMMDDIYLNGNICRIHASEDNSAGLFDNIDINEEVQFIPDMQEYPPHVLVRMDYDILGLSALEHPMVFYRNTMDKMKITSAAMLKNAAHGIMVKTAGVIVSCMRPPTKSGIIVVFITLEDETGVVDVVVFPKVYQKYGNIIYNNQGLIIEGVVESSGSRHTSIIAQKIYPLTDKLRNKGLEKDTKRYSERIRPNGQRSWVVGQGV